MIFTCGFAFAEYYAGTQYFAGPRGLVLVAIGSDVTLARWAFQLPEGRDNLRLGTVTGGSIVMYSTDLVEGAVRGHLSFIR